MHLNWLDAAAHHTNSTQARPWMRDLSAWKQPQCHRSWLFATVTAVRSFPLKVLGILSPTCTRHLHLTPCLGSPGSSSCHYCPPCSPAAASMCKGAKPPLQCKVQQGLLVLFAKQNSEINKSGLMAESHKSTEIIIGANSQALHYAIKRNS